MNNNYRLQLRHGAEGKAFSTRDEVISYINGQLQYGKVELLPYEPILFFYGADDAKNTIIMVGLPEGKTQDGKSYFLVDTANLQEQINEGESEAKDLSEKLDEEIENRKAADKELQAAIDDEIKDRKAADEEEAKLRDEADKELGQLISDEAKNRENADANETKAREDADAAEEKARKEADEKETDERKAADEELQEFIDFSADDIQSLIEACGVIYNEKLAEGRVSYDPDSHDEVIRDAKSLSDAIDKVSKFATNLGQILKVSVEDTDTVDLTMEEDSKNGGSVIKAEVNIAGADGLSKKVFDNNIIGKTSEGIYAAASIEPSTTNPNVLIFKTSGYVDGQFKVDAYETEVPLTAYKGDNGKTTGVTVDVDADKNVISATLNLSSEESNILKLEDGEYVVEGLAKNIKYKDTTVANALTKHASRLDDIEDAIDGVKAVEVKGSETSTSTVSVEKSTKGDFTVSNDVKLSSDNSIVVANGGLSANVNASFKKGTSTLTINVGNTPYNVDLSELAVSVLKSATYDSVTEEIVLTFIVGDTEKTMRIPVGTLIHDVEVDDTDSIDLTLKSVSGGPNHISGEVRIDKTHSDNILTVTSNGLYVSQAYITNAVKEEAESRKEADTALQTKIDELSDLAKANKENISKEQARAEKAETANANAIAQEIKDARKAESDNAANIATNSESIKANSDAIADEIARAQKAEQANTDAISAEVTRAKEAEGKLSTAITSAQTAVEGNVANEKERAMTAEGNLSATITAAQTALEGKIATEETRAKTEESSLSAAITAVQTALEEKVKEEETRAITAESGITTNAEAIAAINETISGKGGLNEKLTNEITRATEKDTDLSDAIKSETERAQSEESTIKKNIESISTAVGKIEIRKIADLEYALYVNDTKHGEFTIPKDQFLKSVNYDPTTKTLVFVFTTSDGDVTQNIAISDLVDTYTNGEGLLLNDNVFSVDFKSVASVGSVTSVATDLSEEVARAKAEEALKANASDVYTKNEITTKLGGYATTTAVALKADAENVYTKSAIDTTLGSYAKSADVYTKSEIDLTLGSYAKSENVYTKSVIDTTLGSYAKSADVYTKSAIDTTLGDYAKSKDVYTKNDITTMLGNYATTTAVAAKADAENVYTKNEITTKLGDYATTAVVADKANVSDVYTQAEIGKLLNGYATTTAVAAKADAENVYTKNDITEKLDAYAKSADVATVLATKLSTTDAENVYATKESLANYATSESVSTIETNLSDRIDANETSIDNFGLTYNSATSELTYTDKNGSKTIYKLYSGSLVKDGTFDTKSNSIVLTIENAGVESKITIPVSELLSDISGRITTNEKDIATINTSISKLAKNWTVKSSSTVDLTKDTSGENDSLTANVKVSTSNKQAIQSTTNGLYVSNDLEDYTVVYGETGTISAQTAISKLLSTITSVNSDLQTKITANANNIATLTKQVEENGSDISSIKTAVSTAQSNISDLKTNVATNKGSIDTLNTTVANIQTNLTDYAKRISTAESNIASINSTLSSVQSSVTKMQNSIETLSKSITSLETTINTITGDGGKLATLTSDVSKLKDVTGSETYASTKTMSARLDVLENEGGASVKAEIANIENNLIGDKTNPVDGSIWAEINNMIDAGTF